MKIEDQRKDPVEVPFRTLSTGDTFEYNEELWVKIDEDSAFSLTDEWIDNFGERMCVLKVKVKIIIED